MVSGVDAPGKLVNSDPSTAGSLAAAVIWTTWFAPVPTSSVATVPRPKFVRAVPALFKSLRSFVISRNASLLNPLNAILDKAVENSTKIFVDEIIDDVNNTVGEIEIISDLSSGDYIVIDIRQDEETIETSCETLKIPFYKLKNEFKKLQQDKEYLFYCDKGILSQLHAQYLRDAENYTNIRVYRP